jgi:hypothetical protein
MRGVFAPGSSHPLRFGSLIAICALAALLVGLATPSRADAARVQCAGTFRVLQDDHVGQLSLPRGNYRITVLASGRPGCAQASALLTRFLEDFDGVLPVPWILEPQTASFRRSASGPGFRIKPLS